MVGLLPDRFEAGDDLLEVNEHDPVVVGEAAMAVVFGGGYESTGLVDLVLVGGQELEGGLKVRAGQAGVGMRAVLLRGASAEPVREAGLDPREVVLDPFRIVGWRGGLEGQVFSVDVDPGGAERLERFANGGVVQSGVYPCH